jgi:hypothetical protein
LPIRHGLRRLEQFIHAFFDLPIRLAKVVLARIAIIESGCEGRIQFTLCDQPPFCEVIPHDGARFSQHPVGIAYYLGEIVLILQLGLVLLDRTQMVAEGVKPSFQQVRREAILLRFKKCVVRTG